MSGSAGGAPDELAAWLETASAIIKWSLSLGAANAICVALGCLEHTKVPAE